MAFENVNLGDLCITMLPAPGGTCVVFPGGVKICATLGLEFGDPATIARGLLASSTAATAAIQPIFDIVNAIKAALKVLQAVGDAFGPPPDPTGLIDAIPELVTAVDKLLALLPPFSILPMIKGILDVLTLFLGGLVLELHAMSAQARRIAEAVVAAAQPGNEELLAVVACENGNLMAQMGNLSASLGPVNSLLGILNGFLELIGLPPILEVDSLGDDIDAAIAPLEAVVAVLTNVKAVIPG